MKMKLIKKLMLFSMFLNSIYLTGNNLYGANGAYEVGTNKFVKDIEFTLIVQDSLLVVPKDAEIDFGYILKGSTDTKKGETEIKIEGGDDIKAVKATYVDGENQSDNSRKMQIKYTEESEIPKEDVFNKKDLKENIETDKIDVYFLPFENSYAMSKKDDVNQTMIPVKAEIRGIGNARLGKYEGKMKVQVEVVTDNTFEIKGGIK